MASKDLGFNDAKLAWGNWDYVDLSHFTKMPGNPITASAIALMKECGAKAQHPGVLAGVASFSAGIALHRMRRSHCKRPNECIDIVSPLPAQDLCKDEKDERSWLPVVLKSAGAACLILAVSRKVRKRCKTVLAAKTIQLDVPVNSTVHLEASAKADEAIFSEACELGKGNGKVQDSIQSDSTKAPSTTMDSSCTASTISSCRGRDARGTTPDRSFRQAAKRSSPSLQMKLASKGIQEDDTGKVALPIMHFKRIQCFEDASPFPSNVPTRSPSPCRKQPENDRPRSRSPEPKEAKGAQGAQAIQGAQKAETKGVSPVVSPSRQKETEQSKLSKPMPKPVPKAPKSPTPAASNQKQVQAVQAVQANPAKASAQAPAKALPKPGDKQESPSPRNGHPPHSVTVARTPEKRLQPAVPEKQESSISSGIQNSSIGQRQPSPLGSSSAAPKAPQKSPRGVGAAGAPSHQKLPASARQADNQPSMKRPITPPTPSRAASAASGENTSSSRGTEVVKPRPQVSAAPSSQTMPVAAPGHRGAPKLEDRQSRSPTPVQPVQPKSSAATPVPSPPVSSGKELPGTGVSPRPPSGRPLATPASSGHQLNGLGKTPRGMQSQGGLPPPKAAASSSSSGPMPAQSSSSLPARSSAPAEEDEYDNYSVYSGSSHSSSSSHHGHRKHSGSGSSSSQSDGARSRSSSSGRQCGNDFLPDISVQVRAPKTEHEDTSHAPQGRADDLCEFHVMHDDDAAVQGGTSLQQEYDQTLRRLGARRAAASQGLQRQVTD